MRAIGVLSLGIMALVSAVVGFRLLALGWRTRQQPELLIALGLLLAIVVGAPLSTVGRIPGVALTPLGDVVFASGLAAVQMGIAFFCIFTWLVFRRDALWATALMAFLVGLCGVEWLGIVTASASGDTLAVVLPRTRPWGIAIVSTVAFVFAWSGYESLAHYRRLRRQLALGLGDPVVANRLGLWAVAGFATTALCCVIDGCMLAGLAPLGHAVPLAAIGVAALTASACWTLAFLPPEAYLVSIRHRAAGAGAAP
ncbi:MAG: hypothetical protein ABFS41_19885 [Myxococcota bacterium]